jgi:hypothetical protein
MPTLSSHTHLQATQSQAKTKACKRVCLPNRTTDRPVDDRKEQRRHNIALAKWPAGQAAIGRKKCYWAFVQADVNQLCIIFYLKHYIFIGYW